MMREHGLWIHLPLLVRANTKESVEYILQALWRTRKTGLDSADRQIICQMLQLQNHSDLDPLLVCLRMLIRKCVYDNIGKDEIHKLFPAEVLPELQRLLTLLMQKFQREWQEDIQKDQLQSGAQSNSANRNVRSKLSKDTLETMLRSMYSTRDRLSGTGETPNGQLPQETNML